MATPSALAEAGRLLRQPDARAALDCLASALRDNQVPTHALASAGRLVQRALAADTHGQPPMDILMLGQCTTTWLADTLAAVAWRHGTAARVSEGPFDNVVQALMAIEPGQAPQVLVLLPWHDRLLADNGQDTQARVTAELAFWQQVWTLAREHGIRRLVQIGHDWIGPGPRGFRHGVEPGGDIDIIRQVNDGLRRALPDGTYFVPLEEVSGHIGRQRFYDARRRHWTRQPFSELGLERLAEHVHAGLRALTTGPHKVLVLDLDNTLWGGVVGEAGPLGVALGDSPEGGAYRAFQRHLKALSRRGVVLAVCSKNNPEDARAPFAQNPDMVLTLDDIACFVANWAPKADNLRSIADALRLSLDSFVFFDDNPAERLQVRQALPEVAVVEVPLDPADYVEALDAGLWFEAAAITTDDEQRTRRYVAESQGRGAQVGAASLKDYLESLQMRAEVRGIDDADMQRVVQLLGKTNQFNLTTRRHTAEDVRRLLAMPRSVGLTLRLADRYTDHGLVALAIAAPLDQRDGQTLVIDSLLMSCRVIGRTAEIRLVAELLQRAQALGYARVAGAYVPSPKNALVAGLYRSLGFNEVGRDAQGSVTYLIALPARLGAPCAIAAA